MKAKNLLIVGGLLVVGYIVYKKISNKKVADKNKGEGGSTQEITIKSNTGKLGDVTSVKTIPLDDTINELKVDSSIMRRMASNRMGRTM